MCKTVSRENWSNRAKTIETKNLHQWHKTPYWLSIERKLSESIIEFANGYIVFDEEKYKQLRKLCLSEEYALGAVTA